MRAELNWKSRDDGSSWTEFELGNAIGILAIVPHPSGELSAMAIVEFKEASAHASVDEAKKMVENWLLEAGGGPGLYTHHTSFQLSPAKRSS